MVVEHRSSTGSAALVAPMPGPPALLAALAGVGLRRATWLRISGMIRLDWRPVVRQIRAKLIGEMSGYGGPNITTRAGTRKV